MFYDTSQCYQSLSIRKAWWNYLYEMLNRWVLREDLNDSTEVHCRMSDGRSFHSLMRWNTWCTMPSDEVHLHCIPSALQLMFHTTGRCLRPLKHRARQMVSRTHQGYRDEISIGCTMPSDEDNCYLVPDETSHAWTLDLRVCSPACR